jgi:nitrogen fixation protein FixH
MKLLLILISIIGLGAVVGAVVVGTRSFDGTVADKPYEQGLAYDAAYHAKVESGWNVEIMKQEFITGSNDIMISVTDRNNKPVTDAEISVSISRPSSSAYDRTYKAVAAEKGMFRIAAELPLYGYWTAKIQVAKENRSVIFEKTLFAEQRGNLK